MNATTAHILIVDDERPIREPLQQYLERNSLRVMAAPNASTARRLLAGHNFDLVILDIMMPGEDGLSLCQHIRATVDIPVILLTAMAEDADRIVGLELGADDYMLKPFNPRELLARVKAVMRRANALPPRQRPKPSQRYVFGPWELRCAERELIGADGVAVPLSTGEYNLLLALLERPHVTLSRDQLLDLTQSRDAALFERSIDNQVSRLRRKIDDNTKPPTFIKTVWGGGYVFSAAVKVCERSA